MIDFSFDGSGRYVKPQMMLCNPDRQKLSYLSHYKGLIYTPHLHGASEIRFDVHSKIPSRNEGGGQGTPYFDLLQKNRLIVPCTDFGSSAAVCEWYVIEDVAESSTKGRVFSKSIVAYNYEKTLSRKNANLVDGTYRFYDPAKPNDTLLKKLVDKMPGWKIGAVDSSLYARWRTLKSVSAKRTAISAKKTAIANVQKQLDAIVADCRIANNFSSAQRAELDEITYQGKYANGNFIVTGVMNYVQQQEVAEQLYERGQAELAVLSQQQYSSSLSAVNFLFVEKFKRFAGELALGRSRNVKNGLWIYPILLELTIEYDNPASFTMLFGTRLRMQRDEMDISTVLHDATSISKKVSVHASVWNLPVKSGLADRVSQYMDNTLSAAWQEIVNSDNQSVTMGAFGLRTQTLKSDRTYSPEQLGINNGLIAMTDDNWQSTKLAIGKVGATYGVNAEVVAGKLIVGNQLHITNQKGSVSITDHAKFTDMDLALASGSNKFTLSPNGGMKLTAGSTTLFNMDIKGGPSLRGTWPLPWPAATIALH